MPRITSIGAGRFWLTTSGIHRYAASRDCYNCELKLKIAGKSPVQATKRHMDRGLIRSTSKGSTELDINSGERSSPVHLAATGTRFQPDSTADERALSRMNVVLSTLNSNTEPAQHLNLWDDDDIGHLLPVLPNIASEDIRSRVFAHSSHHASEEDPDPMQKLELLGDSVLKLVLTRLMLEMYPGLRIGQICTILASLVCNTTLAKISVKYKLPDRLKVQDPGSAEVIRSAKNPQADVFESYIGGLYEDQGGIACVQTWLEALYRPFMTAAYKSQCGVQPAIAANAKCTEITGAVNHVDLLTKYLQRRLRTTQLGVQWEYGGGGSKGRPLEMWSANLFIGGEVFGSGQGPTKKVAENAAAKQGLARMGIAL
ncbi:ribonuclease III domain-containing protein [Mycena vulgaris]|nr:ribonuclease III domain-containing protein [Mycena vulgaris]